MLKNTLFFLFLFCFFQKVQAGPTDAIPYMQGIVNETLTTVVNTSQGDVRSKFKGLIAKHVVLDKVLKQLLVKDSRIKAIHDAGLASDIRIFVAGHLAGIYARQISSGKDTKVTVSPTSSKVTDPVLNETLDVVTTIIETRQYGKIKVEWYIVPGQGIVDAKVEERFRMSLTLRDQYIAIWNESGENPQKFLELLRTRLKTE